MSSIFKEVVCLDTSGHLCPVPILMTEEEMGRMKRGDVLRVTFTDPGARPDLEAWCKMAGHAILEMKWDKKTGDAWIQK